MTGEQADGVAARIWCDPEYSHVVMDPKLCKWIGSRLYQLERDQMRKERNPIPVLEYVLKFLVPSNDPTYERLRVLLFSGKDQVAIWRTFEHIIARVPCCPWRTVIKEYIDGKGVPSI